MPTLNQCSFIGLCGDAPKVRAFESGSKVANVNIAVSERYTSRDGEQRENTEWVPLVFNDKLADIADKFIRKGSLIYVCGKLRSRKYSTAQGEERHITEIVVRELQLLSKKEDAEPKQAAPDDGDMPW